MRKRLQVLLEEGELRDIQQAARRERLTVAEWVRQALRAVCHQRQAQLERKLAAIRKASAAAAPTTDIDQMLAEIELGYQRRMQE